MLTRVALLVALMVLPVSAFAQDACEGGVCVRSADMQKFIKLARDQKCRELNAPVVTSDGVQIILDRDGRVYGSGTGSQPLKLHVDWCNYALDATSSVKVLAAQRVEPDFGFRFRLKGVLGILAAEPFHSGKNFYSGLDIGVLVEPLHWKFVNLNVYGGARSSGLGLGIDLTKNMSAYAGYAITWGSWRSTPHFGLAFSIF